MHWSMWLRPFATRVRAFSKPQGPTNKVLSSRTQAVMVQFYSGILLPREDPFTTSSGSVEKSGSIGPTDAEMGGERGSPWS